MLEKTVRYFEAHPIAFIVWVMPLPVFLVLSIIGALVANQPKPHTIARSASSLCEDLVDAFVREPVLVDHRVTKDGANELFFSVEGVRYYAACEGSGDAMRLTTLRKTMQY